jgi:hypothetical protein
MAVCSACWHSSIEAKGGRVQSAAISYVYDSFDLANALLKQQESQVWE